MLEQHSKSLEQQISYNRALVAMASELNQSLKPKQQEPAAKEPGQQDPIPGQQQNNKLMNMISAAMR